MAQWRIYTRENVGPQAVREGGFNWMAGLFAGIWALFRGILGMFVVALIVGGLAKWLLDSGYPLAWLLLIALNLAFGFQGNRWIAEKLEAEGYARAATVEAPDAEAALKAWEEQARPVQETAAPSQPEPVPPINVALRLRFGRSEQCFTRADGEVLLGRALSNHVIIPLRGVSREHAKISWGEDGWPNLVNLSRKGTSVNDESSGQVSTCEQPQALLGSGVIALSASYREAATAGDIVRFSVEVS